MDIDKLLADSSGDSEETVATKETVSGEETAISPRTGKPIQKKYAPKKKGKPRGGNNWLKPENIAPGLEAGDNTKFLSVNMALMNMPDIDMENPLEVQQRLSDYFALYAQYDMKPTVVGMAIALNGHNRQWLYAVMKENNFYCSYYEQFGRRWYDIQFINLENPVNIEKFGMEV